LTKLLLFGNEVENDLYDWKVDGLKKIKSDIESFNKLIESCNHSHITTSIITSLVRSITLYDVVKSSPINRKPLESINIQSLLEDDDGERFCELLDQMIEQDESLIEFLIQHGMTKNNQSIYSIALLSSIPPTNLIQLLNSIKGSFTNSLNIEDVIKSSNQALNNPFTMYYEGLTAINNLKQLDKTDERVIQILVKFAQYDGYDEWRENAVISLSQFPSK
jgi:hypothetical protein